MILVPGCAQNAIDALAACNEYTQAGSVVINDFDLNHRGVGPENFEAYLFSVKLRSW